jgi:hypothetical protein
MPATAVGRANGKSTIASTILRPGNRYRTSTHATSSPKTVLINAATRDAPKVTRYEAMTRGSVTVAQSTDPDRSAVRAKMVARGSNTTRLR